MNCSNGLTVEIKDGGIDVFLRSKNADQPKRHPHLTNSIMIFKRVAVEDKIDWTRSLEATARPSDPRIKRVRKAAYVETTGTVTIYSHTGLKLSCHKTLVSGNIMALAEEGENAEIAWDFCNIFLKLPANCSDNDKKSNPPQRVERKASVPKGKDRAGGLPSFRASKCPFEHLNRVTHFFGMKMDFLNERVWQYKTRVEQRIFPWPKAQQKLCWHSICMLTIRRRLCQTKILTY
jgi:hypothetical protein